MLLIHEGGTQDRFPFGTISPRISGITQALDPEVDVVMAGHSHTALNSRVDGRLVVQASSFGRAFEDVRITLDRKTRDIVADSADPPGGLDLQPARHRRPGPRRGRGPRRPGDRRRRRRAGRAADQPGRQRGRDRPAGRSRRRGQRGRRVAAGQPDRRRPAGGDGHPVRVHEPGRHPGPDPGRRGHLGRAVRRPAVRQRPGQDGPDRGAGLDPARPAVPDTVEPDPGDLGPPLPLPPDVTDHRGDRRRLRRPAGRRLDAGSQRRQRHLLGHGELVPGRRGRRLHRPPRRHQPRGRPGRPRRPGRVHRGPPHPIHQPDRGPDRADTRTRSRIRDRGVWMVAGGGAQRSLAARPAWRCIRRRIHARCSRAGAGTR